LQKCRTQHSFVTNRRTRHCLDVMFDKARVLVALWMYLCNCFEMCVPVQMCRDVCTGHGVLVDMSSDLGPNPEETLA